MKTFICASVLGLMLASPGWAQSASGRATGSASSSISVFGDALLRGFDFSYMVIGDRNIRRIRVDPDAVASQAKVSFYDKNFDDPYRWRIDYQSHNLAANREGEESGSCRGTCTRDIFIPAGYTFVLNGFDFEYQSGDHHIDQIGVWERNGKLTVAYNDKNNDDLFRYTVHYILVPTSQFRQRSMASGTSAGAATSTIPTGIGVLRGFSVNYHSDDHKMLRFGVGLSNGRVNVKYSDKNSDDTFSWHVDYALF